jgi:hypothetical protein
VIDGVEGKRYHHIDSYAFGFAPDGGRCYYTAGKATNENRFVVGNAESAPYDRILWLYGVWGHVKTQSGFTEMDGGGARMRERMMPPRPLSPDGKHYAFLAEKHTKWGPMLVMVLDGKELGLATGETSFDNFRVSPDGRRVAAYDRQGVVVDWAPVRTTGEVSDIVFSPNGKRHGYRAGAFFVVDGMRFGPYDSGGTSPFPSFGPTTADGTSPSPVFSPSGDHVAWAASRNGTGLIVVDGKVVSTCKRVLAGTVVFDGPDLIRALVVKNGGIWRISLRIPPSTRTPKPRYNVD